MSSIADAIMAWFRGAPPPEKLAPAAPADYPTSEDLAFARQNGAFYGTGYEGYIDGTAAPITISYPPIGSPRPASAAAEMPVTRIGDYQKQLTRDVIGRAALAANRNAISGLGFDPRQVRISPEVRGVLVNPRGAFSADKDMIWVDGGAGAETLSHETLHRGLEAIDKPDPLKRRPDGQDAVLNSFGTQELAVRAMMDREFRGVEEKNSARLREQFPNVVAKDERYSEARRMFSADRPAMLKALQDLHDEAARMIARRRPGGPR